MTTGLLLAVVGPSGVGKDSLIAAMALARPDLHVVRRVITRPVLPDDEAHDAVTEADFDARQAAGGFCLSWRAHGLGYGIPAGTLDLVRSGRVAVVNLSRSVLAEAAAKVSRLRVLNVTARPDTLVLRLATRGREEAGDIRARLARKGAGLPDGLDIIEIPNDGPLSVALAQALQALDAVRA